MPPRLGITLFEKLLDQLIIFQFTRGNACEHHRLQEVTLFKVIYDDNDTNYQENK